MDVAVGTGLSLLSRFQTYGEVYKSQVWVYTVVRKLATATARLPLKIYSRGTDGRDEARDSDFAARCCAGRTAARPVPVLAHHRLDARGVRRGRLDQGEECRELPAQLWPVNPTRLRTVTADADSPTGSFAKGELLYVISDGRGSDIAALTRADVVHFRSYNPDKFDRGMCPLEPLRQTLFN